MTTCVHACVQRCSCSPTICVLENIVWWKFCITCIYICIHTSASRCRGCMLIYLFHSLVQSCHFLVWLTASISNIYQMTNLQQLNIFIMKLHKTRSLAYCITFISSPQCIKIKACSYPHDDRFKWQRPLIFQIFKVRTFYTNKGELSSIQPFIRLFSLKLTIKSIQVFNRLLVIERISSSGVVNS